MSFVNIRKFFCFFSFDFRQNFDVRTFTQHFFAKKCTLSSPDNNFEKSFSRSFTIAFTL